MKREVQYYIPAHSMSADDAWTTTTRWGAEFPDLVAEDCAEDYHKAHGGWEAAWPLEIVVISNGRTLGTFSVERGSIPEFHATRIEREATR